jgi:hypothetical protein
MSIVFFIGDGKGADEGSRTEGVEQAAMLRSPKKIQVPLNRIIIFSPCGLSY